MAKVKYKECPSCGAVLENNTCKYCGNSLISAKTIHNEYDEGFYSIDEIRDKYGLQILEDNITCSVVLFHSYIFNSYNTLYNYTDEEWSVRR